MLTDKDMLGIAEKYLKKIEEESGYELMINKTIKKPLGNVYYFTTKLFFETLDPKYSSNATPFLVEKERRRVLHFGSHYHYELQYEDYKNGNLQTALDTFWYPDEDRFSHE